MRRIVLLALISACDSGESGGPPDAPPCVCDAPIFDGPIGDDATGDAIQDGDWCSFDVEGDACSDEGATCWVEGTARCDLDPPGGGCDCAGGHWSCWSGCAEGCPSPAPPADDSPCDGAIECRYDGTTCRCMDGAFVCSAV